MHAILGTVFIAASAGFFGLTYFLVRRLHITDSKYAEPAVTLAAFVWTALAAFALVEVSNFSLNWHAELEAIGPGFLALLGIACVTALSASNWLVRHASLPS